MDNKAKARNLKRQEAKQVILAFIDLLKTLSINNKGFVVNANTKAISTNPQITIEELQKTLGITENSKLDFIRQMYIRSGNDIVKNLFPDENILNLPVISFKANGESISLQY